MRIVLLGAPGSGKGTQSALIEEKYAIPQISTGDILRQAISDGTEVGKRAQEYVTSGALVPDDVILDLVRDRIDQPDAGSGFILDGFPRTIPQAEGLDSVLEERGLTLDCVLKIDVPKSSIIGRMTSRRVCGGCGAVYSVVYKPPVKDGVCDACGQAVIQREDDTEETVRKRLNIYDASTAPLIDYYDGRGMLAIIAGDGSMDDVFASVCVALDRLPSAE